MNTEIKQLLHRYFFVLQLICFCNSPVVPKSENQSSGNIHTDNDVVLRYLFPWEENRPEMHKQSERSRFKYSA